MKLGNKQFYWSCSIAGILACLGIFFYRYSANKFDEQDAEQHFSKFVRQAESQEQPYVSNKEMNNEERYTSNETPVLFKFDPNAASLEDFIQLGLTPKVAQTIINYRNKGGTFYKPEDFKKIYTLKPADYNRLLPYIIIAKNASGKNNFKEYKEQYTAYQPKTNHPIEMNSATAETWQKQKGIGAGFAQRIVAYRTRLGGFRTIDQLKEVYGLPDSTYENILPHLSINTKLIAPLDLNTATEAELANHPYIGSKMAKNIIKIRTDLGKFNKIEDLKMVPLINEEKYRKIAQYLTIL